MHAGTSVCPGMLPRQRNEGHRLHYPNGRYEDVQEGKTIWKTVCYISKSSPSVTPSGLHLCHPINVNDLKVS